MHWPTMSNHERRPTGDTRTAHRSMSAGGAFLEAPVDGSHAWSGPHRATQAGGLDAAQQPGASHTRAATPINQRRQGYGKPGMACVGAEHPRDHAPSTDGMGRTERVRVLPGERLVVAPTGFEDAQPDAVRPAQTGVDARSRRTGSFPSCNRPAWPAQPGSSPGRADVASSNAQKRNRSCV